MPTAPRRILIIMLRRIGDVLLTAPAARALRKAFPGARIDFLAEPPAHELLEGNPDITEVLVYGQGNAARVGRLASGALKYLYWLRAVRNRRERRERMRQALAEADLAGYEERDPATLSGGQRARVALMRTLLARPRAVLLDEPFSKLDADLQATIRQFVFGHVRAQELPTLMVTHAAEDAQAVPVALAVLLVQRARADGVFSPAERHELLAILREEFALTEDAAAGLLAAAEQREKSAVESFTFVRTAANQRPYAERLRVMSLLLRVAAADGKVSGEEEMKLFKLAGAMNLSTADYGQLKAATKAALRS